jgi:hypothetical protein
MADVHSRIMKQVQIDWTRENRGRLFPNQSGKAWLGRIIDLPRGKRIEFPKMIKYGLANGSSDLIGWEFRKTNPVIYKGEPIRIEACIFCSIEVKTKAYPKLSTKQIDWLNAVVKAGGRAYVARETYDGMKPTTDMYMYDSYYLEEWKVRE